MFLLIQWTDKTDSKESGPLAPPSPAMGKQISNNGTKKESKGEGVLE